MGSEMCIRDSTVTESDGIVSVSTELGAADRNSMLTRNISFEIDLDD